MARLQPMGIRAVADKVGQFNKKVGLMNKSMSNTNKAMGKAQKSAASIGSVLTKLTPAIAGVTAAFVAAKKVLAFGRQGALITQTGESFDFLIKKIGAAPDLLNQLSAAARGTISEMDLMSSTATLLAGVGDELARKLADATPQLLNIAKAANKLNPNLGDTAFFYQSIATGVKRAQPLILDNLGLTLKVGAANKKFAKQIGKTVDELTAEEKAMAILNATLEAGDNLIAQVGGTTEAATDSFDRLAVASTEMADIFKSELFEAMRPYIAGAADAAVETLNFGKATEELGLSGLEAARFIDEFGGSVLAARAEIVRMAGAQSAWFAEIDATVIDGWATSIGGVGDMAANAAAQNRDLVLSLTELTSAKLAQEALTALNTAYKEGTIDGETYKEEYFNVATGMGGMEAAAASGQIELFKLKKQLDEDKISAQQFVAEMDKLAAFDGKVFKTTLEITTIRTEIQRAGLPEFQHGGSFMVGGKPGIDTNLVQFMATRGEVVTVTPAGNVDNRSINMGDINIGEGAMSPRTFDRMARDWFGV